MPKVHWPVCFMMICPLPQVVLVYAEFQKTLLKRWWTAELKA